MSDDWQQLSRPEKVVLLRSVAAKWLDQRGVEAFVVIDTARRKTASAYDDAPEWLEAPAAEASPEVEEVVDAALEAIAQGNDEGAKLWLEEGLEACKEGQAQSAVLALGIMGSTLIGLVLAARVKKIGPIEFGSFPKELNEFLREARKLLVPWAEKASTGG